MAETANEVVVEHQEHQEQQQQPENSELPVKVESESQSAVPAEGADWICPKCGNNNFSRRMVCNMRKCRFPKPGTRKRGADEEEGSGSKRGKMGENWTCKKCGNENFASRTVCNMRKCQEPRDEWICGACGNLNFKYRTVCNMRKCGAPRPMSTLPGMTMAQRFGGQGGFGADATANAMAAYNAAYMTGGDASNGLESYNYNFLMGQNPYMNFGMGQGGAGGGASGGGASGGSRRQPQERKEGDWECEKCGNFNYASRTRCNMRNCQEPRKNI